MPNRYVITMTAANRVGILAAVTNAIADLGGNLVEIRQTRLQGFFTMIIAADFPDGRDGSLIREHVEAACRRYGVDVTLKDPSQEEICEGDCDSEAYVLELVGNDEPGAMRTLSVRLAANAVDITDLHAVRTKDGTGFRAVMQLAVPNTVDVDALRTELGDLASGQGLAFSLQRDLSSGDSRAGLAAPVEPANKPR